MKSLLKILSVFFLIIILPSGLRGSIVIIREYTADQDTSALKTKIRVDSFPLPIIPPSTGVRFFRDKVLFLSLAKNEMKMSADHISFGSVEAYYASILDSVAGKHYLFSPYIPFPLPCEAISFNPTFDTIYFTKLANTGIEKIYMAKYAMGDKPEAGITGELIPMDFCSDNFIYSHPSLSADGNIMIFASNRDGTLGGMDLFITRRIRNIWSVPENLGKEINTPGNEFFPFLDANNNLFFSSDGRKGYGGYDVFRSKFNAKRWDKPVNLSDGVNSLNDDVAFTINPIDKKTAFFTRRSGKNELQLFKVTGKPEYSNLLAIFDGAPEQKPLVAVVSAEEKSKPVKAEPVNTLPEKPVEKRIEKTPQKPLEKPAGKISEKGTEKNPAPVNNNAPKITGKTNTTVSRIDSAVVTIKQTHPLPADQVDVVIYRVQILSSDKPRKEKEITLAGKKYSLYEYFYKGAYRYCIGEYKTAKPALELRKIASESDYSQAFLVLFRNNKRSLNQNSFK